MIMEKEQPKWKRISKGEKLPCWAFLMMMDGTITNVTAMGVTIKQDAYYLPSYGLIETIKDFPKEESEDKKNKRVLHSIANKMSRHLRDIFTEEEFQCFDAWSNVWLEKQGEQKPTNWLQELEDKLANATPQQLAELKEKYFREESTKWSKGDKSYLLDFTRWFEQKAKAYDINLPMRGFDICAFCKEIIERLQICENLVWENIDETLRTNAIIMLKEGACRVYTQDSIDKCVDWLKSLKCRVQPKPKQEWSEEDNEHIKSIISTIECSKAQFPNSPAVLEAYNSDLIWLKSLRPQN